jgi:hypothetical protein
MKPRRTPNSTSVHKLEGGTEDNDLWAEGGIDVDGNAVIRSVWEPSQKEREQLAAGANVYLVVWGTATPPVAMGVTDEPLGK